MAVAEHPEVARTVVEGPVRFGLDGSGRQAQDEGANFAFFAVRGVAMEEGGNAKGE